LPTDTVSVHIMMQLHIMLTVSTGFKERVHSANIGYFQVLLSVDIALYILGTRITLPNTLA